MPTLAITPGEPAGIGPELLLRFCQNRDNNIQLVAIASKKLLNDTVQSLGLPITLRDFDAQKSRKQGVAELDVIDIALAEKVEPGTLNKANAAYVLKTLEVATDACLNQTLDALVTGPVQKSIINDAGIAFSGHTEFLAERAKKNKVVMMLATEGLRVALATTHLPLREVADAINTNELEQVIDILHHDLKVFFGIKNPRVLVCGLNPHAGEGGHLGMEEIEIISPLLEQKRKQGMNLVGPLPADTLFTPHHLNDADAVLAMYHDQGLPVLKHKGFGAAVNITLGLPFIRTSVDHGTALDLVGKNTADIGSLETAIDYAQQMVLARNSDLKL